MDVLGTMAYGLMYVNYDIKYYKVTTQKLF